MRRSAKQGGTKYQEKRLGRKTFHYLHTATKGCKAYRITQITKVPPLSTWNEKPHKLLPPEMEELSLPSEFAASDKSNGWQYSWKSIVPGFQWLSCSLGRSPQTAVTPPSFSSCCPCLSFEQGFWSGSSVAELCPLCHASLQKGMRTPNVWQWPSFPDLSG